MIARLSALFVALALAGAVRAAEPEGDAAPGLAAQLAQAEVVTGADIAARVVAVLAEAGQLAEPAISAERRFHPCVDDMAVAPRVAGDWRTVVVTCGAPVGWSVTVRTGARAATPEAAPEGATLRQVDAAEIDRAVRDALALVGEAASPVVTQSRTFYPCAVPLEVAPRIAGDWRTVSVSCAEPARWTLNLRTVPDDGRARRTPLGDAPLATAGDIEAVVRKALAEAGIEASPRVSQMRRYYPCSGELSAAPRYGSDWRTVEVRCSDPMEWSIHIRTTAHAAEGAAAGAFDITAADVEAAVVELLDAAGMSGEPVIPATRRFYPCSEPLSAAPRDGSDWSLIDVRCSAPFEWSLLVRANLTSLLPAPVAEATPDAAPDAAPGATPQAAPAAASAAPQGAEVVALRRSRRKGAGLTAEDIVMIPAPQKVSTGLFSSAEDVIGRTLTQTLGEGRALHARHLEHDWLVREGNPVMIVNAIGGFEIITAGKAVGNGQLGDIIEVQNISSGDIIQGVVEAAEKIRPVANMN
ncbi:MAG: flagellar basal body P-ring formation chaperone FlgA [Gemmobacter sp.]